MAKKKKTKISVEEKLLLDFIRKSDGIIYNYLDEALQLAVYHTNSIFFDDKQQMACSILHEIKNFILEIERPTP